MSAPLNILVIEDSQADFKLIERHLKRDGREVRCARAATLDLLTDLVEQGPWDIVLIDYSVPGVDFFEAFVLVQDRLPDVPVIVVSGSLGEERAVELLKTGVSDFVLKDRLVRLGPAIERSLREVAELRGRRAAERELQLRIAALSAAAEGIVITDRTGTITWVNPAFTTLTGYVLEEAVDRKLRDLVNSGTHDHEFFKNLWDTILAGQTWRGEITNRRRDRGLYPEHQAITPVTNDAGEIVNFVAIKRDLTDERRLHTQLLQAQKMESVGRLAGGLAHDFGNLISAINGTAELASRRLQADDPGRADFEQILACGERAASLIHQLLAFSRKQARNPGILSLRAVVTRMEDMLQRLLGEDVKLTVTSADDEGTVLADRVQLEQVIMNMVVNAKDAMPNGGALTIQVNNVELDEAFAATHPSVRPGPHVVLTVRDTGTGMNEATRNRLFEPFFTTKEPGKGTGLGLATVYGIVKQSNGSIWVSSELGRGTVFEIFLPRVAGVQAEPEPPPAPAVAGGDETILIAEDDDVLQAVARRVLELAGYTVLTASDGEEALAVLRRYDGPIHLMLTDVVMPGLGGRDLVARVPENRGGLKILYTSGYSDDVVRTRGLVDPTVHFLGKPYNMNQLTSKVREVLDASKDGPVTG